MVSQFRFPQFLFACEARILVKLDRHIEARCLLTISLTLVFWHVLELHLCRSGGHRQLSKDPLLEMV